jgi:cell division cycle protein 20 (cofactor of APC complex)
MLVEGRKAKENPLSQSLDQKLLAEAFQYERETNFSLEEQTTHPADPIPLFSSSSSFHPSKPVKPQRHIPQVRDCSRLLWIVLNVQI